MESKLTKNQRIAHQLAIFFTDENDLPLKLKNKKSALKEIKINQVVEIGFQENIKHWTKLVEQLYANLDSNLVNRIVQLEPDRILNGGESKSHPDYQAFEEYVQQRQKNYCKPDELGRLHMLLKAFLQSITFQNKAENNIMAV